MLEKLKNLRTKVTDEIKDFVKNPFNLPPTYEELLNRYPHKAACSRRSPLQIRSKPHEELESFGDGGTWGVGIYKKVTHIRNFLDCEECGTSVIFRNDRDAKK